MGKCIIKERKRGGIVFKFIKGFDGENIKINSIEANTVHLEQEIRDSGEWWFWWNFKIEVDCVQTIRFIFDNGNVVHKKGVCYRFEDEPFAYSLEARISASEFEFYFDKPGVWQFAFSIPYLLNDWQSFINGLSKKPNVVCVGKSEQGRALEIIDENPTAKQCIVMTCRHHACESVAAFSMEGAVKHWLESELAKKYRLIVFPFVDLDGVQNGDQGKSRLPHDHNRDYIENSIYESVRFLKKIAQEQNVKCLFDMHCPAAYGGAHDHLSLIGLAQPYQNEQRKFASILEQTVKQLNCPIEYDVKNDILYGEQWNKGDMPTCSRYFAENGALLSFTFEHPFAGDMEKPYSPDDVRAFGKCFAVSVEKYLGLAK